MEIKLIANFEKCEQCGYIAWIEGTKNFDMVVQGQTPEKTTEELITSLKVTMSYLFGIDINSIEDKQTGDSLNLYVNDITESFINTGKKEIKWKLLAA